MVLYHVTNSPGFLIIGTTSFYTDILCYGDLHMIDVASVPDGLEDAICQAEDEDVLYRLFPEIVIDTVDLFLSEDLSNLTVQFASGGEVMPKGFLDDDTRPPLAAFIQSGGTQLLNNVGILA